MSLTKEILSKLIYAPSEIKTLDIKEQWFYEKSEKEIISALIKNAGADIDPSGLYEQIKQDYPLTTIHTDLLADMRIDGLTVMDLPMKVKQLKQRYVTDRLSVASRTFADYPSEANRQKLTDVMREVEKSEAPEDDGRLDKATEEILHELDTPIKNGILTYQKIDDTLGGGIRGGMLITIGARPGVGKTAYGINLACQALAKQKDIVMDFFTLEMSRNQMMKRFISRLTEINSYKLRNPYATLSEREKNLVTAKAMELLDTHLRIHDKAFGLKQIELQIRRRHHEANGKPYIAFVDYLGLIDVENKQQPRHVQVGEVTRVMKILTNELDIPIVLFSQLNRAIESRQDKKPNLSDLRESGSVEQDSNVVMFLYVDPETDETIVHVAKNREGYTGDIRYNFLKTKMYFQELSE